MSIESVMPSNHLILCHPLLLPSVSSNIRVFSSESTLYIRWPKCWSFNFSISPSSEYSGLISFNIDWFDLAVQGSFGVFSQHHSSKASTLRHSAFFMVQLTSVHNYWKNHSFYCMKVMSLFFNTLSGFVLAFLSRSKCLLISRLQSLSSVILKPKKIKSVTGCTFPSSICHKVMEPDAIILAF